jgi:hypothetical protein
MNNQNINQLNDSSSTTKKGSFTTGILLIGIGLSLLLFRVIDLPELFPLFLGLVFLVAGALTRKTGLIIPGGILSGAGLGVLATTYLPQAVTDQQASGGFFMLAFALGWFSIVLFTRLFTGRTEWWPLIPGSILAAIGGLILGGENGLAILKVTGDYWPVILVLIGIWVLTGYFRSK